MSTIVTRSGKGAALTHTEVDANFTNLNTDKAATADVILATQKGAVSGVCPLDATSKVSSTYLPSYVDDVLEYANYAALPATGETGKIYVALDTNKTYRWSGSAYIYITSGAVDSVAGKTGVVTLTSTDVGLSNVDNTTDLNKPISTATQTALDLKAPLASPTFTGTVSGISKAMVGLSNVDNTTDASKPVSTAAAAALLTAVPLQTGNSGKYLSTNGTATSWTAVDALPAQTGNSGKYLTTSGTAASWAVLNVDPNVTTKGLYEHSKTISANYAIGSGNNASSVGPMTIASGVSVTVPSGSRWMIL
jgi:hypothetical protein